MAEPIELSIKVNGGEAVTATFKDAKTEAEAAAEATRTFHESLKSAFGSSVEKNGQQIVAILKSVEDTGHASAQAARVGVQTFSTLASAAATGGPLGVALAGMTLAIDFAAEAWENYKEQAELALKSAFAHSEALGKQLGGFSDDINASNRAIENMKTATATGASLDRVEADRNQKEAKEGSGAAKAERDQAVVTLRILQQELDIKRKLNEETKLFVYDLGAIEENLTKAQAVADRASSNQVVAQARFNAAEANRNKVIAQEEYARGKATPPQASEKKSGGKKATRKARAPRAPKNDPRGDSAQKDEADRRAAALDAAKKDHEAALQEEEVYNRLLLGVDKDAHLARAKLDREALLQKKDEIVQKEGLQVYEERLAAANARIRTTEKQEELDAVKEHNRTLEEIEKARVDKLKEASAQMASQTKDMVRQTQIAQAALKLIQQGMDAVEARKQAEGEIEASIAARELADARAKATDDEASRQFVANAEAKAAATENLATANKKAEDAAKGARVAEQLFTQAVQFGAGIVSNALSSALDATLKYSKAQEELASLAGKTAEQQQAEQDAATQATLADISKQAAAQAVMSGAAALSFAAFQKWDSAGLAAASAGLYASIALGTGLGALSLTGRGNTQAEDEQIAAAQKKKDKATNSNTSGNSAGSGGSGGTPSGERPLIVNVTAGGGFLSTASDIQRAIELATRYAGRRA